ncbi:hypothetical protein O3M35_004952 [Rhynocoris fuscipes]|uniref:General transcription factor 3C polypeptide 5 n=1 Tax=Rhynocoris fuscipes TaxID=488301 RepID=A0AAW1DGD1_9HEMI
MEVNKSGINKDLVCVEYPGIVQNVDKMLETLGGLQEISHIMSKKNRRLELRFRPDDVHCKPACGDRVKTNALLLRIKVKKKSQGNDDNPEIKSIEIVGRIQTLFKFKSKCDFQYLPMLEENGKMKSICHTLLPPRIDGDHLNKWLEEPAEYFLPPAVFSRVDTQTLNSYMYRKDKKDLDDPDPEPLIGRTRKRRSGHAIFVSYNIPAIPAKPREIALKYLQVKFLNGEHYEKIKSMFEERPIWSKLALMAVTKLNHDQLKYLLPAVAYYFATGPFRVMWVRFGYDPRKDPASRIYQTLDYRIRAPAGLLSLVKAKRSYANYLLTTKSSHPSPKSVVITKELFSIQDSAGSNQCNVKSDAHIFTPGILPPARQMFYQYCDIKAPELESMLARLPKVSHNMTCDPKNGWLPSGFDNQARDIINMYVVEQLNKDTAAESLNEEYPDDSSDEEEPWNEEFEDEEIDDIEGGN